MWERKTVQQCCMLASQMRAAREPREWYLIGNSGKMPEMYLELSTALAGWGSHGGHGGHGLIRHGCLQRWGRPGQRGQGNGLGQRLEDWAGQTTCSSILH